MHKQLKIQRPRQTLIAASIALLVIIGIAGFIRNTEVANAQIVPIIYPVIGGSSYTNDFNAHRPAGPHHAIDIFANKGRAVVAAADGIVRYVPFPEPSWGYMITIDGNDGYTYSYIHLNNDNPGTDDGKGGGMHAYAPDIVRGNPVKAGQLIGWVGDSGNAENTPPHLHFEIYSGNTAINPFESLNRATRISRPVTNYPQLPHEYLPYGQTTQLKANVAVGNLDSNPLTRETVIGAGFGGGPHIKVADQSNNTLASFFAYDKAFRGGAEVAVGDINGDGVDEIVTGAGPGGGPHVKVYSKDGILLKSFMAYDKTTRFGVRVGIGDVNGDGVAEIVTAPLAKHAAPIRIFDLDGGLLSNFYPYTEDFKDGVDLAIGDVNGDGVDEIVTAPGKGSGPQVRIFDGQGVRLQSYFVYDLANRGGVRVDVGNVIQGSIGEEIVTVPDTYGGPHLKVMRYDGRHLRSSMFLETWWRGGYDVGASEGRANASAGEKRRTTIRTVVY